MPELTNHRRYGQRRIILLRLIGVLAIFAVLQLLSPYRLIVLNTSPSVPPGLYVRYAEPPRVGMIVDFRIPLAARNYIQQRTGQLGDNWYILKPIVAGPGDTVDTTGPWLRINGRIIVAMPPERDTAGRLLPLWRENRVLHLDEFFVFSPRIPNSFDSRCYGPITRAQIAAVRRPLITW